MSLFEVKNQIQITTKFFYPFETLNHEEIGGMSLEEEVMEQICSSDRVEAVMQRFSIYEWDQDEGDYIFVKFRPEITTITVQSEIANINHQLGYIWDWAVTKARINLRECECENCDEVDDDGNCRGRDFLGKCQGGVDTPHSEDFRASQTYAREELKPKSQIPPENIWNANTPLEKEKDKWNIWNR